MKLYVASKFENYREVEEFEDWAIGCGHVITYSWTPTAEAVLDGPRPGNIPSRESCALDDFRGVKDCHVFVLLLWPGLQGALVEFGMALAMGKEVWLVGEYDYDVVFFHLPTDIRKMSMDQALNQLKNRLPSVA